MKQNIKVGNKTKQFRVVKCDNGSWGFVLCQQQCVGSVDNENLDKSVKTSNNKDNCNVSYC